MDIVKRFIDRLPKSQKVVLSLRVIDQLSLKEICEKTNKDMNYVKTTQKRCIKNLKKMISEMPVMEVSQ